MIVVIFLFALSLFSADLTQESLLEIIWDSTTPPSPQQFQELRQRFPSTLLTPQQALAKIIPIAKDALNEYPNDIHLLPSYMQNLEQVCLDVAEILPEIAQMARNDDPAFLQTEYQDALYSPNFADIFGIHMVLHTTDMFFLYKAFLEHPEKDQINETLNTFEYTSNLPLLNIHSKEDLKQFLLNIKRNKDPQFIGRLFTKKPECPPNQFNVLFGFINEFEPSADIYPYQLALSCARAHYSNISPRYIFTDNGLFPMISDPVAVEGHSHLISLPTKISSTSYTLQAHQAVCGLAHRHTHDYVHLLVRHGFFEVFDMVFEPAEQSQEQASSLFSRKCMDYVEHVILTKTNMPLTLHTFKMLYLFNEEHETRGIPTRMCSVQKSLEKMLSTWVKSDPDLIELITFAKTELLKENPDFNFAQAWGSEGKELANFLAPHFKFKDLSELQKTSSTEVFNALPESTLQSEHTYEHEERLDQFYFSHVVQQPNPFTHSPNAGALETSFAPLGAPPPSSLKKHFHITLITLPDAKKTHSDEALSLTKFLQRQYDTRPTPKTQSLLQKALDMNVPFATPYGVHRVFIQNHKPSHVPHLSSFEPNAYYFKNKPKTYPYSTQKRKTPLPFTVFFEKSSDPFSSFTHDVVHKTLIIRTPSLSQIHGVHHRQFLEVLACILGDDLTQYCCLQQYYQVHSTNFIYSYAPNLQRLQSVLPPLLDLYQFCADPEYKGIFFNLTCNCSKPTFNQSDDCSGGSLFA